MVLADTHVLFLSNLNWLNVDVSSKNIQKFGRYNHSSAVIDTHLIIFGGISED